VQQCTLCQRQESRSLTRTRAAALFTHPLRPAIHSLKYENRPELADSLARYLVAAFCADMGFSMSASISPSISPSIDVVMPVPLHEQRQRERGYNQAELLAHAFCRRLHLPIDSHGLVRVRATVSQVGLRAYERQQNVNDAFRVRADVRGSTVLLIDDVFTTGATLTACATMLREAGAASVYALALATPPVQADAMC
jgi:ComF family protein